MKNRNRLGAAGAAIMCFAVLSACSGEDGETGAASASGSAHQSTSTVVVTVSPENGGGDMAVGEDRQGEVEQDSQVEEPMSLTEVCRALETVVNDGWEPTHCDGSWAIAVLPRTDMSATYRWSGGGWDVVPKSGRTFTGLACYESTDVQGIPEDVLSQLPVC